MPRKLALLVLGAVLALFVIVWVGLVAADAQPPAGHKVLGPGMCRHYAGHGHWVYRHCAPRHHHRPYIGPE